MKFNFKIQQYQTEAVEAVARVFNGQPHYDKVSYIRDLSKPQANQQIRLAVTEDEDDLLSETGYKNETIELTDEQLLDNIRTIQNENNIKVSDKLIGNIGRCSLDIEMETGTGKAHWTQHTHLFKNDKYECSACGAMHDKPYLQTKTDGGILFHDSISGHRRVHAAELLEMKEVPAVVHFIDRDQATILMVDSNCQRENLSLMEKARSYRMKLDAIKHQGTSRQNVEKSEVSAELISENDSGRTVQRLIRLTYLVPELQEYVDSGKMKMLPAYELSFLNEEAQRDVIDRIDETESFPSHAQARRMRAAFEEGKLDYVAVTEIMNELKPNQVEKLKIPLDDIRKYVPSSMTPAEMLEYLLKLVKREYDRQHSRNAR